jgi:hypothetical protein
MYVRRHTTLIGENAGKIWRILNQVGCSNKEKIIDITRLEENEFHASIGWLARENKISKEEDCFRLGTTNLKSEIGTHAGKIWKILDIWGDADLRTIKRLSSLEDNKVQSALGWLAREDKIIVNEKNKFELK